MSTSPVTVTKANETLFRQSVLSALKTMRGEVLVDIGGFDGEYSLLAGNTVGAQTIYCIDHDDTALRRAKKRGLIGIKADLNTTIPLASDMADVIICNQVIEHIAKTDFLVKEMARILKPGGKLLLCTPNLSSWHNIVALLLGYQPFSMQISDAYYLGNRLHPLNGQVIHEEQAHLRVFTHFSLTDLCLKYGFKLVKQEGVGFYPFSGGVAKWLARIDRIHSAYILLILTC
jgi:2-polyprenyl-3-methyl-5-hydroxy-6-metoxy-1,4-benzoquinol methylase